MNTNMISVTKAVAVLLFVLAALLAETTPTVAEDLARARGTAIASAAVPLTATAVVFSQYLIPAIQGIAPWIANPLLLGTHIPLYWLDPARAAWYTGSALVLPAAGIGLMAGFGSPLAVDWGGSLLGTYSNLMLFSAYDTSLESRRLLPSELSGYLPADSPRVADGRLWRLAAAPFTEVVADPLVWVPTVIAPALLTAWYLLFESEGAESVGSTGTAYVATSPVSPFAGGAYTLAKGAIDILAISVGEEAFYRGVLYDSVQRGYGRITARVVDSILFPLVHLPVDISQGLKPETMIFNFAWRAAMTLVFDAAYDKGGLPLSIATHFWSDLVLVMSRWWFYGGSAPAR